MALDRMILGENIVYSTDSSQTGLNNNVLVCGSSGCGKTMSISEPCFLETIHSSLIATVTKRRIVNKYKALFRKRGYLVLDLNFINPAESNVSYDPLKYINNFSDIPFVAGLIVKANPRKERSTADPYWDDAAISLLSALIAYTIMTGKDVTFVDVLLLHEGMEFKERDGQIVTSLDDKFESLAEKSPNCFAVSCWNSFRKLGIRTASCVFSTLNTSIDTIFTPEIRKMIATKKKVDFRQLASKKTVLFVSTSAVNSSLHCLINIFYAQAFQTLFEYAESLPNGRLPIPVHVLCDDFAVGSRIQNFPEYVSVFRESRISATILVQSESQLESMYGITDATTIINNCDTYIYLGGQDLKTCRSISERLNLPLEDVLYMPIGQEFIFRRGQKPIITKRYNIEKNQLYGKITEEYEKKMVGRER